MLITELVQERDGNANANADVQWACECGDGNRWQAQVVQGTEQEQGHAPTASREPALPVTLLTCCSTILYESQGKIFQVVYKVLRINISVRLSLKSWTLHQQY